MSDADAEIFLQQISCSCSRAAICRMRMTKPCSCSCTHQRSCHGGTNLVWQPRPGCTAPSSLALAGDGLLPSHALPTIRVTAARSEWISTRLLVLYSHFVIHCDPVWTPRFQNPEPPVRQLPTPGTCLVPSASSLTSLTDGRTSRNLHFCQAQHAGRSIILSLLDHESTQSPIHPLIILIIGK